MAAGSARLGSRPTRSEDATSDHAPLRTLPNPKCALGIGSGARARRSLEWNASARTVPKESRGAMAQCDDGMNTLAQIIHESLRDATVPSSVSPGSGCLLCLVELSEQRLDRLLQLTHACLGDLLAV